jgi:hypothetical protein
MVDGEVNELGVYQDMDQSPEEPKAIANIEEGKHQSAYNLFWINSSLLLSAFMLCFLHLCFRSCFETEIHDP